jgi:hypothetical protein
VTDHLHPQRVLKRAEPKRAEDYHQAADTLVVGCVLILIAALFILAGLAGEARVPMLVGIGVTGFLAGLAVIVLAVVEATEGKLP